MVSTVNVVPGTASALRIITRHTWAWHGACRQTAGSGLGSSEDKNMTSTASPEANEAKTRAQNTCAAQRPGGGGDSRSSIPNPHCTAPVVPRPPPQAPPVSAKSSEGHHGARYFTRKRSLMNKSGAINRLQSPAVGG